MPCCPFLCVRKFAVLVLVGAAVTLALHAALAADGPALDPRVRTDEAARVAAIAKVQPAVVAIFSANPQAAGQGGGSGVLIDKEGYALTNFHVVQGAGDVMYCGLPDGVLYDAVVVGLDKVGDVALVKLLPKDKGKPFPFAALGDSDTVKAGDWAMALGNPFLLATDFKPTVTFGLVSGIHRYQYPSGTLLEYTDCIQVDTSINPGNSGGPLFNMKGELIGINGRGSFDKRGRVNSGVGYAISINQIKNFLGHLRAGIDTDHATLGAIVETDSEDEAGERLLVRSIIEDSDVRRRGLDVDDELVSFAGRPVTSVNQYKNVLGLYPKGWRVPLVYRRNNVKREILVRLMQLQRTQTPEELARMRQQQPRRQPIPNTPAAKLYEPRPGYANYHFNKVERDRLLAEVAKLGDFIKVGGDWTLEGDFDSLQRKSPAKVMIREEQDTSDTSGKPVIREWTYHLNPKALPPLAEEDRRADQTPLRQSVRKAMELLRKHALAFPQEIWAKDSEARTKEYAAGLQKEAAPRLKELSDALAALQKAAKERDKERSRLWQAQYDYALARLSAFVAYVHEYNHLLGQLTGKDMPPRDPRRHRGWRMVPDEKIQDADAVKYANEANRVWAKMIREYNDTVWEDRAQEGHKTQLGLKWKPSGGTRTVVHFNLGLAREYKLDPLKVGQEITALKEPTGSGGLLAALYQYRRLLTLGATGFEANFAHGGREPIYPTPADPAKAKKGYQSWRVDTEVLLTEHAAMPAKWYFSPTDHTLLGFEVSVDPEADPCEVYLSDYRSVEGRLLPHRFEVRHGNDSFGTFTIKSYQLAAAK